MQHLVLFQRLGTMIFGLLAGNALHGSSTPKRQNKIFCTNWE